MEVLTDPTMCMSYARTALDDPGGLPQQDYTHAERQGLAHEDGFVLYAIDRIDEAMHLLDTELHPALALRTMASLADEIPRNAAQEVPVSAADHISIATEHLLAAAELLPDQWGG